MSRREKSSARASLPNSVLPTSAGKASAGLLVSPSKSRTVALYSARVSRRAGDTGGAMVHEVAPAAPGRAPGGSCPGVLPGVGREVAGWLQPTAICNADAASAHKARD